MGNLVGMVGGGNVGKCRLFNGVRKRREGIVKEEGGRRGEGEYGKWEWVGGEFWVVDRGGWVVK